MANTRVVSGKIFKDRSSGFTAAWLAYALERIVSASRELARDHTFPEEGLRQELAKRGSLPIQGIIRALDPEQFKALENLDPEVIWQIYWEWKNDPAKEDTSIFTLLAELNRDPPFASGDFAVCMAQLS